MVRISDVARAAGVSVGTVSNVLNRPGIVHPETRDRVHRAIHDLGFVPNASARNLREGASRTVGVVVLDIASPFFMEVARGVEDRLVEAGLTMMLSSTDADPGREQRVLEQLAQQRPRGVLLTPSGPVDEALARFAAQGTRVVLLDHDPAGAEVSAVVADDVAGARAAVEHLLALGHRRVGFLNGPVTLQQCRDRRAGVGQALAGVPGAVVEERTVPSLDAAGGSLAVDEFFGPGRPSVSAVFCVNDLVALGALRRARERGLRVPEDVSVAGYDDVPFAGELAVPLTSVRQPTHDMGWEAAGLLLEDGPPRQVVFTPRLVVRSSTGEADTSLATSGSV